MIFEYAAFLYQTNNQIYLAVDESDLGYENEPNDAGQEDDK